MTADHAAFLRAIIAQPDDDIPRLIFADWLQERGEDARAEFIRVQIELAKMPKPDPPQCQGQLKSWQRQRLQEARHRERESLGVTWEKWIDCNLPIDERGLTYCDNLYPSLPTPTPNIRFARGFVSQITCTWADWSRHADAILAASPIRNANDGLVRLNLTTPPDWARPRTMEPTSAAVRDVLLAELVGEWPGVRFELPPATAALTFPTAGGHVTIDESALPVARQRLPETAIARLVELMHTAPPFGDPPLFSNSHADAIRSVADWRRRAGV